MCNQVGVIDKDYYNNKDNEGHIWVKLQNEGDKDYIVKKGEGIIQGIFMKYLTIDSEEKEYKERESDY
jgi:dUTP pyrophosphatase